MWYLVVLIVGLAGGIYVGSRWPQWFYLASSRAKLEGLATDLLAKVKQL